MSEFNIEDLDAVISEAKSSLVQMLALQLKNQLKHGAELAVQLANAESKCRELAEFLLHIKKCLVKNGEYAPLSHEEIDTILGIRADGKGAAL